METAANPPESKNPELGLNVPVRTLFVGTVANAVFAIPVAEATYSIKQGKLYVASAALPLGWLDCVFLGAIMA